MKLKDRVAIITGAATGIGYASAEIFLEQGAKVAICDVNADKIALTGSKLGKNLYEHSGFPGGLRADSYGELLEKNPERIIRAAVKGMLPKNRLAKVQLGRLRVFRGAEHPHASQNPVRFEITQVSQQAK